MKELKALFGVVVCLFGLVAGEAGAQAVSTGKTLVTRVRRAYASGNVTTGAWVQLIAATPVGSTKGITEIEIFDSSGQTLELGFGGSGSEVSQIYIVPGGNGRLSFMVPTNTRVSIRAVSATAAVGELDINFYH